MKKLFSLVFAVLLLCGCSSSEKYKGEIYVFLPGEYINEDVVTQFEKEYKIKVNIDNFDSNESMYTKLMLGTTYDIVIPSDYMVERLIEEKMVQPLDKDLLPNLEYLYEGVKNQGFDPDNTYSVPYFWGNVGIVYDETQIDSADVEKEGWSVLKNPKYKDMLYMYDSERDSMMIALKSLGYSMNTNNENELNEAYQWLLDLDEKTSPAYVTDEAIDGLAYGEKAMGVMYSGDAAYILSENENARFFAPEGTNFWVDCMMIHKDAENVEYAHEFINYIIGYDAAYDNSSYVGYASVNSEVLNDLSSYDGDFADNEAYFPRTRTEKDEVFHSLDTDTKKLYSELWVKVKNNNN